MEWQIRGVWASLFISLVGLGFIVWTTEPPIASTSLKILFFATIFILIWSTATLIIFPLKSRLIKSRALSNTAYEPIFYDSFLTGLFLSVIFVAIILIKKIANF
jgi:hypothetical protein